MALFLRGDIWWYELRSRHDRIVKSTGFRRAERKKAQAVFDALRLARSQRPPRQAVESILDAIYGRMGNQEGIPLEALPAVFADWCRGKNRRIAENTKRNETAALTHLCAWASRRGIRCADGIDVATARAYASHLRAAGRTTKTIRNKLQILSHIWSAVGQLRPGIHNPWPAATPNADGKSIRREAFTPEQERAVLAAAEEIGHGWHLASVISRWTGLRYGDVARLEWTNIDLDERLISLTPSKTARHGVSVRIPIAAPLLAALAQTPQSRRIGFVLPEHAARYRISVDPPFAAVLARAKITGPYTFHSWRHTFRTRLAEAGVGEDAARRLGGWTSGEMAAHYDHASHAAELRAAIDRMEAARKLTD